MKLAVAAVATVLVGVVIAINDAGGKGPVPPIPSRFDPADCAAGTRIPVAFGLKGKRGTVIECVTMPSGTRVLLTWRGALGPKSPSCSSAAPANGGIEASFCVQKRRTPEGIARPGRSRSAMLTHFGGGSILLTGWSRPGSGQARVRYTTRDGYERSVRARLIRPIAALADRLDLRHGRGFFAAELPERTDTCRGITIRFDRTSPAAINLTKSNASGVPLPGHRQCRPVRVAAIAYTAEEKASGLARPYFSSRAAGSYRVATGRSAEARKIRIVQQGVPAVEEEVLVFGCIHGDECAAKDVRPLDGGCPPLGADVYTVPNLNPDGLALGTRLNANGVDLNRNFPSGWRPIAERGSPQYSGPHPFSEPETRLAARIIRAIGPEVTIWFHQHWSPRPLVRAWGQSVRMARRFAALAELSFKPIPWLAGTAPNWQNHAFPGTASFVVELPRGPISSREEMTLGTAIVRLAREEVAN